MRGRCSSSYARARPSPKLSAWSLPLGRESKQGQHVLYDGKTESVAYARTLMRLPNVQKWNKESIAAVRVTPWSLHEAPKPDVVFREQVEQREAQDAPVRLARRVYIKPADLTKYG